MRVREAHAVGLARHAEPTARRLQGVDPAEDGQFDIEPAELTGDHPVVERQVVSGHACSVQPDRDVPRDIGEHRRVTQGLGREPVDVRWSDIPRGWTNVSQTSVIVPSSPTVTIASSTIRSVL